MSEAHNRFRLARVKRRMMLGLGLLAPLCTATGCGTAIKRVYYEFRGAKAKVHPTGPVSPGAFDRFNSLAFSPVVTESGDLCPPGLLAAYDAAAERLSGGAPTFDGGPPTLRVESEMLYFQGSGVFKTAMCLVRVKMFDDARLVEHAIVAAESKSIRGDATNDLPVACVKGLGEYLARQRDPTYEEEE